MGELKDELFKWIYKSQIPSVPASDNLTREQYLFLATVAEKGERYEEMLQFMKERILMVTPENELTHQEILLWLKAYRNVYISLIDTRFFIVQETTRRGKEFKAPGATYKSKLETDLCRLFTDFLMLLDSNLILSAKSEENKILYPMLKGECHGWIAHIKTGDLSTTALKKAERYYNNAQRLAMEQLEPYNYVRLLTAYSFAYFNYHVLDNRDKACALATEALNKVREGA